MSRVAERITKSARVGCSSRICFLIVTNSARGDLASALRFAARRVASVALVMGCDTSGNCERSSAAARATVTGCTATRWPGRAAQVLSVIEFDVEALIKLPRETLQRWVATANVGMADDAHGDSSSYKLSGVATDAGFVSWKTGRCRVVFAFVTGSAGKRRVTLTSVLEG